MRTPSIKNYYSALQEQFKLQSSVLTDALPHSGERGRNDEERFREFLGRILPKKYSVGSGFVICSDPSVPVSSQTDVVLFDEFHNSPIHRELASHVYPVEMVYGTVEVKGRLEKRDLKKICSDIAKLRALGEHRYYLKYGSNPKNPDQPAKRVVTKNEYHLNLSPRAFVFAYEQKGWRTISDLVQSLKTANQDASAHIHGLAVLTSDWYVRQEPFADDPPQYFETKGDALLKFVNAMLHDIGSFPILQMSFDRYYASAGNV